MNRGALVWNQWTVALDTLVERTDTANATIVSVCFITFYSPLLFVDLRVETINNCPNARLDKTHLRLNGQMLASFGANWLPRLSGWLTKFVYAVLTEWMNG